MERVPHVAIYIRVSTIEQADDGLSKDAQPALCLKKLDEVFGAGHYTYEVFEDLGRSGSLGPMPWDTERKKKDR
ncbi:MAG: recombinase family protein, partial [Chthonomonadaceae bacterium]|nr:recombinase family protein [Chthonomonadaceae bacterium]